MSIGRPQALRPWRAIRAKMWTVAVSPSSVLFASHRIIFYCSSAFVSDTISIACMAMNPQPWPCLRASLSLCPKPNPSLNPISSSCAGSGPASVPTPSPATFSMAHWDLWTFFSSNQGDTQSLTPSKVHQLAYNVFQKVQGSVWALPSVIQRSQEDFCPPTCNLSSSAMPPRAVLPSVLRGDFLLNSRPWEKLECHCSAEP